MRNPPQSSRRFARSGRPARRRKKTSAKLKKNANVPHSEVLHLLTAPPLIHPRPRPAPTTLPVFVPSSLLWATLLLAVKSRDSTPVEPTRCTSLATEVRSTPTTHTRRTSRVSKSISNVCLRLLLVLHFPPSRSSTTVLIIMQTLTPPTITLHDVFFSWC